MRTSSFAEVVQHTKTSIYEVTLVSNLMTDVFDSGVISINDWEAIEPMIWSYYKKCRKDVDLLVALYTGLDTGEIGGYILSADLTLVQLFTSYEDPEVITYFNIDEKTGILDNSSRFDYVLTNPNDKVHTSILFIATKLSRT